MRAESWSLRTWLLAVVAGWAVLAALLALFGLGSRITPLPADPGLIQALPRLPPSTPERLGALSQYADVGARPLFSEDRRPKPFFLSGDEAAAPAFDLVLTSVLITPALELAIVQPSQGGEGLRVKVGESPAGFPGWRLTELGPRRAVFDGPEGRRELELRVFDGTGGQPPTALLQGAPGVAPIVPPPAAVALPPGASGAPGGRTTGGNSPPAVMPGAPALPSPAPLPATSPSASGTAVPLATADDQMEQIRQRIEQRRAQLRQQQAQPTTPPATPGKTQ
ncbi:hypothetical protein [Pseudoxanthomonas mexicana]|uniref:hypothetical protein n=1 Tax=Pseudoxanthomonas mexicana TaxID=128785 RepID=UPI0007833104|nr:hypothetical protein [Pseudoxanthomonas mexicana]